MTGTVPVCFPGDIEGDCPYVFLFFKGKGFEGEGLFWEF